MTIVETQLHVGIMVNIMVVIILWYYVFSLYAMAV